MERELWPLLYRQLRWAARRTQQKYAHHQPWLIAAVLLWAAVHDRPVRWACDPADWGTTRRRPRELPSAATVSRRAKRTSFALFLNLLSHRLRGDGKPSWTLFVDGKPLVIGLCGHDPDARPGRGGRGYKLHAIWGTRRMPEAWEVTPLNEYEGAVAIRLLPQLGTSSYGYLLADGNYDASRVFAAADEVGYQLVAPPEDLPALRGRTDQHPARRRCVAMFRDGFGQGLLRARGEIERRFGNAGSFGGGLGPLPNWVRRLGRVTRWVWCKLAINAARILFRQQRVHQMQ
jgi:hypothetical protein